MKQFILLTCLFVCSLGLSAQVYVDADATGSGDGTSWADAYTNLNDAIIAAAEGSQIWVAEGTYTTSDSAAFFIDKALSIYGGFDGTEGDVGSADPSDNLTILNGDVAGDDGTSYDSLERVDNNRILIISDTSTVGSTFSVTLDGLMFMNGSAPEDDGTDTLATSTNFAGGAIWTTAQLFANRLSFMNNYAETGSNLFIQGANANGSRITNTTATRTYTEDTPFINTGHAFMTRFTDDVVFEGGTFTNDDVDLFSGVMGFFRTSNTTVRGWSFNELFLSPSRVITSFDNARMRIVSCDFRDIQSEGNSAGILSGYLAALSDREYDPEECVVDSCTFAQIFGGRGPAFRSENSSFLVQNSRFDSTECINSNLGGALYAFGNREGERHQFYVDKCEFNNAVVDGFGGGGYFYFLSADESAITTNSTFTDCHANLGSGFVYYDNGYGLVDNCQFIGNGGGETDYRGAGMATWAFGGALDTQTVIRNSLFQDNDMTQQDGIVSGGALYVTTRELSSPGIFIENTDFLNNNANSTAAGGALFITNGAQMNLTDVRFIGNTADRGGATNNTQFTSAVFDVDMNGDTTFFEAYPEFSFNTDRVMFFSNFARSQGGAMNVNSGSGTLKNTIFASNAVDFGGGSGGAIILNNSTNDNASSALEMNLIHTTFYNNVDGGREAEGDNLASAGDNIAVYQPGTTIADSNNVTINMLNSFFLVLDGDDNVGIEREPSADDPDGYGQIVVNSLGGNFTNIALAEDDIVPTMADGDVIDVDIADADAFFQDPDNLDDELAPNFRLICSEDNPLIDGGVYDDRVTALGYYGNARGIPDIGAAEADAQADCAVSTADPIEESGLDVDFFPNPTVDYLTIRNNETSFDRYSVIVIGADGRVVGAAQFTGTTNQVDLTQLPTGTYTLQLIVNDNAYSKQIVKQ